VLALLGAFALGSKIAFAEAPPPDIINITINGGNPNPAQVHIKNHGDAQNASNNDTVVFKVADNSTYQVHWTGANNSPFVVSGSHDFTVSQGRSVTRNVLNKSGLAGTYHYTVSKATTGTSEPGAPLFQGGGTVIVDT
jgi:hypothetical protein